MAIVCVYPLIVTRRPFAERADVDAPAGNRRMLKPAAVSANTEAVRYNDEFDEFPTSTVMLPVLLADGLNAITSHGTNAHSVAIVKSKTPFAVIAIVE